MPESDKFTQGIYSRNTLEFVTVAAETCLFLENTASLSKKEFLERALKILPLLYLKTSLTNCPEQLLEEAPERFITETDYELVKSSISDLLGSTDRYLEVFHPDIQLSEEGIATDISENLADIYQDLKDFLLCYQIGNEAVMNDALTLCLQSFYTYWGQRLVNALRPLHNSLYNEAIEEVETNDLTEETNNSSLKHQFLSHQQNEGLDAFLNTLNDTDAN